MPEETALTSVASSPGDNLGRIREKISLTKKGERERDKGERVEGGKEEVGSSRSPKMV